MRCTNLDGLRRELGLHHRGVLNRLPIPRRFPCHVWVDTPLLCLHRLTVMPCCNLLTYLVHCPGAVSFALTGTAAWVP